MTAHDCMFPEILVEYGECLAPCAECGETPLDTFELAIAQAEAAEDALAQATPERHLFHWSPATNRKQIVRYGLRPGRRPVTHSTATDRLLADFSEPTEQGWRAPYTCFADSPSWAWALSGDQRSAPPGWWDCWQTELDRLESPIILPSTDRATGIHEVRTEHRLFKRGLWLVGSRHKRTPR